MWSSHSILALFHVFSFTTYQISNNKAMCRRGFGNISNMFRHLISPENLGECCRHGSCYTKAMNLDRSKLTEILDAGVPPGVGGVVGVTHDSRRVEDGFAFVAIPGFKRDGTEFAPEALWRGASLIVAEHDIPGVPTAVVEDARGAMALLAREVNGDPSRTMEVYGVTGTNG